MIRNSWQKTCLLATYWQSYCCSISGQGTEVSFQDCIWGSIRPGGSSFLWWKEKIERQATFFIRMSCIKHNFQKMATFFALPGWGGWRACLYWKNVGVMRRVPSCIAYLMNETKGIRVIGCRWSWWGSKIDGEQIQRKHSLRDLCLVQLSKKRYDPKRLFLVNKRSQSVSALLEHERILGTETISISQLITHEYTAD